MEERKRRSGKQCFLLDVDDPEKLGEVPGANDQSPRDWTMRRAGGSKQVMGLKVGKLSQEEKKSLATWMEEYNKKMTFVKKLETEEREKRSA
ncbi:hypothetical protein BDM02DRAFT_3123945 [Thelephora ganbajun]|uniref:Uncharacterized protein n=1 Tax=Thelephora ganbajun TaxID=370292 RepID=A0ACB6Z1K5_THEGA|nr:hypothetical protein BDM02DRAFT_3123945 [Thelephora ganbajun]